MACKLHFLSFLHLYDLLLPYAVDIISAIEFDKSGDHLATGDRGGRVVLFERTDVKDVCYPCTVVGDICTFAHLQSSMSYVICFFFLIIKA